MKVIFLDIDGVLNSIRSAVALGGYPYHVTPDHLPTFDWVAVGLMQRVCKETGAVCVLSSTWRKSVDYLLIGEKLELPIIGVTPVNHDGHRGGEISLWIDENGEPKRWAIVDDDSDMLEHQLPRFVHTDIENGFSLANYRQLIALL